MSEQGIARAGNGAVRMSEPVGQGPTEEASCDHTLSEAMHHGLCLCQEFAQRADETFPCGDASDEGCFGLQNSEDFTLNMPLSPPGKTQVFSVDER